MLKSLGFLSWAGCLLTLAYQSVSWFLFNTWPTLDMLSTLHKLFGLDLLSVAEALPPGAVVKLLYVAMTTELSLFLWWTGVIMFGLMSISLIVRK